MNALRRAPFTTPRLLVVGLVVFGLACHKQPPVVPPAPTAPRPAPAPVAIAITSAPTLIQAMRERYTDKWYRSLTFVQRTTVRLASGAELPPQTWYEALEVPGRLRIDTDLASKSGVLYAHDSLYRFTSGKLVQADTGMNELLTLGFDVYALPSDRAERLLRHAGFDLTKFHEAMWQGTPVYVVGAVRGDTLSKQFWVERDRLLFVRLLQKTRQGRGDIRFNKYVRSGGGWVAAEVEQYVNGRRQLLEEYSDIRTNVALSPALFDARQWASAPHWTR